MGPIDPSAPRVYVVLVFVNVSREYYEQTNAQRDALTAPHIQQLTPYLKSISLTSLRSTGLSPDIMIEVLESNDLLAIEKMIETYKAGAKAAFGAIEKVIITEKGMVLPATG